MGAIRSRLSGEVRLWTLGRRDRAAQRLIRRIRSQGLTFLSVAALVDLAQAVRMVCQAQVRGVFLEAGCALGGSALLIAALKERERQLRLFDLFGRIPPPSEADGPSAQRRFRQIIAGQAKGIRGGVYYGYQPDLLGQVVRTFEEFGFPPAECNIKFIRGRFQDTLHLEQQVAFAHIDADWYDSVMICLERVVPHLAPGGVLVIDDYDYWEGCRKAVDDYFSRAPAHFRFMRKAALHVVREAGR